MVPGPTCSITSAGILGHGSTSSPTMRASRFCRAEHPQPPNPLEYQTRQSSRPPTFLPSPASPFLCLCKICHQRVSSFAAKLQQAEGEGRRGSDKCWCSDEGLAMEDLGTEEGGGRRGR